MVQRLGTTLGLGAREGRGLAGEGGDPALEAALGEERDPGEREDQQHPPQEDGGPVDGHGPRGAEEAARGAALGDLEVHADQDGADERGEQAGDGQHELDDVAAPAGQERLGEHAQAGHAEDDEERPDAAVLHQRLGELAHQFSPSSAVSESLWASASAGAPTSGGSSLTPTCSSSSPT